MDSLKVIGGRIPAIALASELLPLPGLPMRIALWPPAAAISSPRFAASCPMISEKSMTPLSEEPAGLVADAS